MGGPSRGGHSSKDLSPGSCFSILDSINDKEFPKLRNKNKRANDSFQSNSFFSKNSRLDDLKSGPKYIVMGRNEADEQKTMNFVSPFTIQKCIELQAGEPKSVKRLRNGTILIETVNLKQAEKLYQLKLLGSDIHVKVYEHPSLNQSKGTIYCPYIIYESDAVLLRELKSQQMVDVVPIKKRKNDDLVDTGVFILTFKF